METDHYLLESPKHFAAIRQVIPYISKKVLAQQLRELANDGIVQRKPTGAIPAPVEYSLIDYVRWQTKSAEAKEWAESRSAAG